LSRFGIARWRFAPDADSHEAFANQFLMRFVSGLMLGMAILHLLPHATEVLGSSSHAAYFALGGIIGMFLLLRAFHSHSHSSPATELPLKSLPMIAHSACHAHSEDHDHSSEEKTDEGLHTMMDGVGLAC